jgi:hypothetical protein
MQKLSSVLLVVLILAGGVVAQVLAPTEIKDPELRALQEQYMDDLKKAGRSAMEIKFDYPFYFSRKLDIDEQQQKRDEQRSLRFDRYQGKVVLEITGNYFAAYPSTQISPEERAHQTFTKVVLPILEAVVPPFQLNASVQGYAFEISHHILGKVMGVSMERPENLVVVIPQKAAVRLLGARDENVRQAALLEAKVFLNAEPITLWLSGKGPQLSAAPETAGGAVETKKAGNEASVEVVRGGGDGDRPPAVTTPAATTTPPPAPPIRDTSTQALSALQNSSQDLLSRMVKDLDSQAHFVSYAAPSYVAFRHGIYLEMSINTTLRESQGSRYRIAALAFDDHIAHLIRPVLGYFKADPNFDGVGFSTSIHAPAGKADTNSAPEAVEFFFPFSALRCYENYDCTGQQLLDAGTVLINGERVTLDLQVAEGGTMR